MSLDQLKTQRLLSRVDALVEALRNDHGPSLDEQLAFLAQEVPKWDEALWQSQEAERDARKRHGPCMTITDPLLNATIEVHSPFIRTAILTTYVDGDESGGRT